MNKSSLATTIHKFQRRIAKAFYFLALLFYLSVPGTIVYYMFVYGFTKFLRMIANDPYALVTAFIPIIPGLIFSFIASQILKSVEKSIAQIKAAEEEKRKQDQSMFRSQNLNKEEEEKAKAEKEARRENSTARRMARS